MFMLIVGLIAIATVCVFGYIGSQVLLFGLVKPEDVESKTPIVKRQSGQDNIFPERKPVARSLTSHYKRANSK